MKFSNSVLFNDIPVWIISLIHPEAVSAIDRNHKELCISFLFYFHCVKRIHLVFEPIDCLLGFWLNVNQFFGLGFHGVFKILEFVYQPQQRYFRQIDGYLSSNLGILHKAHLPFEMLVVPMVGLHSLSESGLCPSSASFRTYPVMHP